MMDRRNVEPSDMEKFPVPFSRLDDPRIEVILELEGEKLEAFLIEAMGIASDYRLAINEFLKFRLQFQDGDVPPNALDRPTAAMVKKYAAVLKKQLGGLMDRSNAFAVTHSLDTQQGVGVITAKFTEAGEMPSDENTDLLCATALSNYRKSTANSFTDGLSISYDDSNAAVSVVKPLEYFRWTIDSAFADSRQVMDTFVKGAV